MKVKQFVDTLKDIAENYETLYVYGCFGAHLREDNVDRYIGKYAYNQNANRKKKIRESADKGIFGFDCVCLIKGILWGWNGNLDAKLNYGGAAYESNGVPDINCNKMLNECYNISADFSNIEVGEYLWMPDHCGVYIGDGLAVECTPIWKDGVQITAVSNIERKDGYNHRQWEAHGKLSWVDYTPEEAPAEGENKAESEENEPEVITPLTPEETPAEDKKQPEDKAPTEVEETPEPKEDVVSDIFEEVEKEGTLTNEPNITKKHTIITKIINAIIELLKAILNSLNK